MTPLALADVLRAMEEIRAAQAALPAEDRASWQDALETAEQALPLARSVPDLRPTLLVKGAAWTLYAHELLTRS